VFPACLQTARTACLVTQILCDIIILAVLEQGVRRARCFFNVSKQGATKTARLDRLAEVVESALPEGAELVEARFSGGPLLTLLVDREDGPVDHEFCSQVLHRLSPLLEEEGYDGLVEISSPGIERPLTKPEHFERYIGREVKVRVSEPIDGQRNFTGTIERVTETGFVLKLLEGGAEVELPFGSVTRANLKEDI
jgi:ribosome maturation factor RimP